MPLHLPPIRRESLPLPFFFCSDGAKQLARRRGDVVYFAAMTAIWTAFPLFGLAAALVVCLDVLLHERGIHPLRRLEAEPVDSDSPPGGLGAQDVTFSDGASTWVEFAANAMIPRAVRRADLRWEWKVSRMGGHDVAEFACATTGPHRVYTVLDVPTAPWVPNGMDVQNPWTDALELACTVAEGRSGKVQTLAAVTSHLFHNMGFRYDTKNGMPSFLHDDGAFDLTGYVRKMSHRGNLVNCFDQGHAVSIVGGIMGVSVAVKVIRPFGYLEGSYLIGRGFCNNPFYDNNYYSSFKLCPRNDPARSPFSCHCFVMYDGQVFDACVGPVTGNLTLQQYLDLNVDLKTTLSNPQAGTLVDVTDCHIVTTVK